MEDMAKLEQIERHWKAMASENGMELSATTKCSSIKRLEINELANTIQSILEDNPDIKSILEVGCGNGYNLVSLKEQFPAISFTGIDYIPEMIESAKAYAAKRQEEVLFYTGNILKLHEHQAIKQTYDIVFTDRCLINLPSEELQIQGFTELCDKAGAGKYVILIENFVETYEEQNQFRSFLDLPPRVADNYNKFLGPSFIEKCVEACAMKICSIKDFGSLHDLFLYVLLPKLNDGKVCYDHPLVDIVTELSIKASKMKKNIFGALGQNRLYFLQKGW